MHNLMRDVFVLTKNQAQYMEDPHKLPNQFSHTMQAMNSHTHSIMKLEIWVGQLVEAMVRRESGILSLRSKNNPQPPHGSKGKETIQVVTLHFDKQYFVPYPSPSHTPCDSERKR